MDSYAELRSLLKLLREKSVHPCRISEHAVLDRLLYKNRSQHRHGLYFRRLEHVRRAYRTSCTHGAWGSIDAMLRPRIPEESDTLGFSTVDLEDVERVHGFLVNFSANIIPSAALSVINQLVLRGHFTNFSVAVVAALARIFVIEKTLCVEVSGVLSRMRVLLAIHDQAACFVVPEDVGEPVQQELVCKDPVEETACSAALQILDFQAAREAFAGPTALVGSHVTACNQSLYDIIAPDDPEAGKVLQTIAAAGPSSSAFAAPSLPFGRPSAQSSISYLVTEHNLVDKCTIGWNTSGPGRALPGTVDSPEDGGQRAPKPSPEFDNAGGEGAPLIRAVPVTVPNPNYANRVAQCQEDRGIATGHGTDEAKEDIDDIFSAIE
jgi:hypothetical protein